MFDLPAGYDDWLQHNSADDEPAYWEETIETWTAVITDEIGTEYARCGPYDDKGEAERAAAKYIANCTSFGGLLDYDLEEGSRTISHGLDPMDREYDDDDPRRF